MYTSASRHGDPDDAHASCDLVPIFLAKPSTQLLAKEFGSGRHATPVQNPVSLLSLMLTVAHVATDLPAQNTKHTETRISHSASKAQYKGATRNHLV